MRKTIYSLLSILSAAVLSLSFLASNRTVETTLADSSTTTSTSPETTSTPSPTTPSTTTASPEPDAQASSGSDATTSSTGLNDGTYTGDSTSTPYGPVQVEIVVSGGSITSANAVIYPNSSDHDQMINSQAVPILNSEVLSAQGDQISMVTGATYTSEGYLTSLQSALDQAAS